MNKSKNLYPNSSFGNNYKEHILKQINEENSDKNDNKNVDNSECVVSVESRAEVEIQTEIELIKSLTNQLLKNQERILDELVDLKSAKIERKSSLVDRIFRSD